MVIGDSEAQVLGAADRVAGRLRERILQGDFPPGSPLREVSVAAELEISRNTLREALRLLASDGLVVQVPNKGAAIRRLSAPEVRDIYRVRRVLEVQAARDSALAGDESVAELEAAVIASEQAERDGAWRAAGTASLRFHQALVALLESGRLDDFFHRLLAQLRLAWSESWNDEEFQRSWAQRDRELYELLRTGRRESAIGALLAYLEDSERQVLDLLRRSRTI